MINRNEYINNYKRETYKRISFELKKTDFEEVKAHTQETSETVNGFIKRAIKETLEREKKTDSL